MSTLATLYNKSVEIQRPTDTVSRTTYSSVATGVACVIRAIQKQNQLVDENNWGKEFKMTCSDANTIYVDDRIVDGTDIYTVVAVTKFEDLDDGTETHFNIRLLINDTTGV